VKKLEKFENQKVFELNVYFVRIMIRFHSYSYISQNLQIISNYANSALKYPGSLEQTVAQCTIFLEGTLVMTPHDCTTISNTECKR